MPGCVSRASTKEEYIDVIRKAGFEEVEILENSIISLKVQSKKSEDELVERRLVVSGKEIKVELTVEEDEKLQTLVQKAHIQAFKPL